MCKKCTLVIVLYERKDVMKKIGYPDKPVASITEDLFDVEVYVNALCSFIRSCETPMTVSIQGDWGSGKTSMTDGDR